MVFFSIDSEISFDEWEKTIYHHAHAFVPTTKEPKKLFVTAQRLLEEAKKHEAVRDYDSAYFYVVKCLQVFDKEKTGVDVRRFYPDSRHCMLEALDAQSRISSGGLKKEYAELIQKMRDNEQRRSTTVAHQLETDPSVDYCQNAHIQRQQQLLSSERDEIDALRAQLGQPASLNLSISSNPQPQTTSFTTPAWPTPQSGTTPSISVTDATESPTYPVTQYGGYYNGSQLNQKSTASQDMYQTTYGACYNVEAQRLQQQFEAIQREHEKQRAPAPYKPRYAPWTFNLGNFALTAPRRGIVNLGNTCYMNSVLQAINATPLADYFMGNEYQGYLVSTSGGNVKVANACIYMIRELRRQGCNFAISSSAFRAAIGEVYEPFGNSSQQDANEFLRVLLDSVHNALNERVGSNVRFAEIDNTQGNDEELSRKFWAQYMQQNSSVVSEYCAFQERSLIVCPSCGQASRSFATAFGIEVPIPKKSRVAIEDCLEAYTASELLDADSLYACSRCKKKVRATKRLQFYSAPKMLFVTLKRFRSYGDFSNVAKINDEVFFERALDLSPFMCSRFSNTQYNLVGVVKHQGNMHGGHYTADAMGPDKVWCDFSDERVVRSGDADFRQAYILCYTQAV